MTGTYQLPDGRTMSLSSAANMALFKRITAREIYADLTSIVQGCLDADLLADGDIRIIDPDEFLNRGDKHQCPYCAEILSDANLIPNVSEVLADAVIDEDDFNPDFPFLCPVCGEAHHTEDAARYCCENAALYQCPHCGSFIMKDELQPVAVPDDAEQWLAVSEWLGRALSLFDEPVLLTNEGAFLWARAKATPSPEDDPKLAAACATAEILEGQKHYKGVK